MTREIVTKRPRAGLRSPHSPSYSLSTYDDGHFQMFEIPFLVALYPAPLYLHGLEAHMEPSNLLLKMVWLLGR